MPRITVELLRKRSEHNEGIISTLEEISLHQEELEKIEVIGTLCRKLRILYLQNNIIEKIEDLTHMKDLRYLNLALNNISRIEGLGSCEFLNKLDLTVNFIDFDTLEESIDHLKPLEHLRELYLLGNPSQSNWTEGLHEYVVASLPQLELLDGKEIHRSDRIKALQVFPDRLQYVREQAVLVRAVKEAKRREEEELLAEAKAKEEELADVIHVVDGKATDISDQPAKSEKKSVLASQEKVPYTPETRREMYMELAEQKEEEEARKRENMPQERNAEAEHEEALRKVRMQEERDDGTIRQCNEGKWEFRLLDEILDIILEVDLPRFLDTSLIDVDVHPSFVSIVIKNKIFRLRFPELVHSDAGKAERSKVTGTLRLTLPKAHVTPTQQLRAQLHREELAKLNQPRSEKVKPSEDSNQRTTRVSKSSKKLSDELLEAASVSKRSSLQVNPSAVNVRGLVRNDQENQSDCLNARVQMTPVISKTLQASTDDNQAIDDDDEPPLLF